MKYNFDQIIDRHNTGGAKWDAVEAVFGTKDVLPMWVADMDFAVAKPITEALRKRTEHEVYGYTQPLPSVTEAVVDRMQRKYNWKIEPEWIVYTPGVVPALFAAVRAFTKPGDGVVLQGPVYMPFWSAITSNGCCVADNELKLKKGRYEIDFKDLESKFCGDKPPKMMILCHPHNPVGRVWTEKELRRMGEIVMKNDALMVSDEIHCELLFKGYKHIPFASISKEFAQNSIVCMAPSKTFNLAGLSASTIIIPNKKTRDCFCTARMGFTTGTNAFGLVGLEAAYRYGDEWLEQLIDYVQGNLEFLMKYFEEKIPEVKVIKPEGTYLVWLDCRKLARLPKSPGDGVQGMSTKKLRDFFIKKAKVGLEDGTIFGPEGSGFQRMNIACPRATLKEALGRIERAVRARD
ncbi:MAG: MalY/PatB family protein [Dehalococcoidales bacterium]|nr:MalY/PatB family protein [Dehalococcoidales bacterium]